MAREGEPRPQERLSVEESKGDSEERRGKKSALMMVQETVKEAANIKVEISAHHVPCAFYS